MEKLKLAMIGCGAIAKGIHLPVAARSDQVEVAMLVDKFLPCARELAERHGVPAVADDYQSVVGQVDAAIVALPSHLHAPVAIDLLRHGVHVLVEKPMALSTTNCDDMIETADDAGVVLAVGLIRRFFAASQWVKQVIENEMLGNIVSFDVQEGSIYSWSPASDWTFCRDTGGGVLVDIGSHVLDMVLWWLGDYDSVRYEDDAQNGVEANCRLDLRLQNGASGIVELSRNRALRNSCVICGERGTLEIGMGFNPLVRLHAKSRGVVLAGQVTQDGTADKGLRDAFLRQLEDFADAIRGHREPFVPGREGKRAIELIEACHSVRQPSRQSWVFAGISAHSILDTEPDLSGKQVLVTGGTGFVGGRLVERLALEHNAHIRVLIRSAARVPRIARFPIEMVHGDVTDPSDVERAVNGCEVVFHCAATAQGSKEIQRLINVEGTRNILEAARRSQVKRVVHLSSMMVYGRSVPDGDLDETAPRRYSGGAYSDTKLDAEELALRYVEEYSLPIVVLQPTGVYGPFGGAWTTRTLHRLKAERVVLVNGGDGLCNAVYVDDVVSAILLAAVKEEAVGEAFLISDGQPVTWREFFGRYARMLSSVEMVDMSATEVLQAYQAQRQRKTRGIVRETLSILREEPHVRERMLRTPEVAALKKVARSLVPERIRRSLKERITNHSRSSGPPVQSEGGKPIGLLSPLEVQFYVLKTKVRIDKAKRILGYQPAFDLESGMRLTEQWARWANLL